MPTIECRLINIHSLWDSMEGLIQSLRFLAILTHTLQFTAPQIRMDNLMQLRNSSSHEHKSLRGTRTATQSQEVIRAPITTWSTI